MLNESKPKKECYRVTYHFSGNVNILVDVDEGTPLDIIKEEAEKIFSEHVTDEKILSKIKPPVISEPQKTERTPRKRRRSSVAA